MARHLRRGYQAGSGPGSARCGGSSSPSVKYRSGNGWHGQASLGLSSGAAHDAMGGDATAGWRLGRQHGTRPDRHVERHIRSSSGRMLVVTEPFLQSRDGLTWCYRSAYSNPPAVAAASTSRRIINHENCRNGSNKGLRGLVSWRPTQLPFVRNRGMSLL